MWLDIGLKSMQKRILRFWLFSSLKGSQLQLATAPQPISFHMIGRAFESLYITLSIAHLTGVTTVVPLEKFSGAMNVARHRLEKHEKARDLRFWLFPKLLIESHSWCQKIFSKVLVTPVKCAIERAMYGFSNARSIMWKDSTVVELWLIEVDRFSITKFALSSLDEASFYA